MTRTTVLVSGLVLATLAASVAAQETSYRSVDSPYQDGFDFSVNTDIRPMVEIAGVRWTNFGLHIKGDKEIDPEKEIPVTVELDFINTNSDGVTILVIALLEDEHGNILHRVEYPKFKAAGDRPKESSEKFRISGQILETTRRVYLFCEVEG